MNTVKDYKNVTAINPIFEISLIKMTSMGGELPRPARVETVVEKKAETPKAEPAKPVEIVKPVEEVKPEPVVQEEEFVPSTIQELENVIYLKDAEQSDSFVIDDDLMIKVMAVSKKELKQEINDGWKNIKKLSTDAKYGKAANLLIDGRPLVVSNKVIILEYPLPKMAEKVNAKDIQLELQTVINHVFKKQMFVYAVSRKESVDFQSLYMNLLQVGKLPKAKDVQLEFEGE